MIFQRDFYAIRMVFPWDSYGTPLAFLWDSMICLWYFWDYSRTAMEVRFSLENKLDIAWAQLKLD